MSARTENGDKQSVMTQAFHGTITFHITCITYAAQGSFVLKNKISEWVVSERCRPRGVTGKVLLILWNKNSYRIYISHNNSRPKKKITD